MPSLFALTLVLTFRQEKMKAKVDAIAAHGINCFVNRQLIYNYPESLLAEKGIVVTAYSPLGSDNSPLLKNDVVVSLAEKYSVSPANILVSFHANTPNVNGKFIRTVGRR